MYFQLMSSNRTTACSSVSIAEEWVRKVNFICDCCVILQYVQFSESWAGFFESCRVPSCYIQSALRAFSIDRPTEQTRTAAQFRRPCSSTATYLPYLVCTTDGAHLTSTCSRLLPRSENGTNPTYKPFITIRSGIFQPRWVSSWDWCYCLFALILYFGVFDAQAGFAWFRIRHSLNQCATLLVTSDSHSVCALCGPLPFTARASTLSSRLSGHVAQTPEA